MLCRDAGGWMQRCSRTGMGKRGYPACAPRFGGAARSRPVYLPDKVANIQWGTGPPSRTTQRCGVTLLCTRSIVRGTIRTVAQLRICNSYLVIPVRKMRSPGVRCIRINRPPLQLLQTVPPRRSKQALRPSPVLSFIPRLTL